MSISVIDYIGDYANKDVLPTDPIILIVCEEFCLVPDSLKAVHFIELDYCQLQKPGIFVLRVPNDFYRGVIYGHIYFTCPTCKFYTSRLDMLSSYIPSSNLFQLSMPFKLITFKLPSGPKVNKVLKESSVFNEIYEESLQKFVKMYLLDNLIRTNKTKSMKSQLKNLIEGVAVSLKKKSGRTTDLNIDEMVDVIISDLENHGILMCGMNTEYNDGVIEEYFGKSKTKIFIPAYRNTKNRKIGNFELDERVVEDSKSTYCESETSLSKCQIYSEKEFPKVGFREVEKLREKKENFVFKKQETIKFREAESKGEPERYENDTENSKREKAYPLISKPVPIKQILRLENWERIEEKLDEEVTAKARENIDSIDSCLKLFRLCNRTIRDYLESKELQVSQDLIFEAVKRSMRIQLDLHFRAETKYPINTLIENINKHGLTKLHKRYN